MPPGQQEVPIINAELSAQIIDDRWNKVMTTYRYEPWSSEFASVDIKIILTLTDLRLKANDNLRAQTIQTGNTV